MQILKIVPRYVIPRVDAGAAICLIFCTITLASCAGKTIQSEGERPRPSPSPQMLSPSAHAELSFEDRLFEKAEAFLAEGKLLSPAADNAYIRYRALQMVEPDGLRAQAGLDAILIQKLDHVRTMMRNGRFAQAESELDTLKSVFGDVSLVQQFDVEFKRASARWQAQRDNRRKREQTFSANAERLDGDALSTRGDEIKGVLYNIAQKIKKTNQSVYIYARSDAEGRWIYKMLKESVSNYLIRGDIRIGPPAVEFLPPLD